MYNFIIRKISIVQEEWQNMKVELCQFNCIKFILQRNAFSNPARAIVKVMTMTTGELDYDDIFHQQEGEEEIAFLPTSFILWIVFLVLIPVLLNNLLVSC